MGDTFLVTGAAGCIGAWTVRQLLDDKVTVVATDVVPDLKRLRQISQGRDSGAVEFVQLDLSRPGEIAGLIMERGISHVVHLAALQVPFCADDPVLGAMVNVVGTLNVFEGVRNAGRRIGLTYASSAAVYGSGAAYISGVVDDGSRQMPNSHYGVYKVANEGTARMYAMQYGIGSIGLRPFVVYGPGRDRGLTAEVTRAMLAAAARVPYHIKFGGTVLLTHAQDVARTFVAAARAARGTTDSVCLNVPGRRAGVLELVELIEDVEPETRGLLSVASTPVEFPSLLGSSGIGAVIGEVHNRPLRDGISQTITDFRVALASGLVEAP